MNATKQRHQSKKDTYKLPGFLPGSAFFKPSIQALFAPKWIQEM
jgi:hypothetical protein